MIQPEPTRWGMTAIARPEHSVSQRLWATRRRLRDRARPAGALLTGLTAIVLALFGSATAGAAPARADIFGIGGAISDTIEDWICSIVAPSEPWEPVGSGPESWLSNKNLGGLTPIDPVKVMTVGPDGNKQPVLLVPADAQWGVEKPAPSTMDAITGIPAETPVTLYEVAGLRGLQWVTIPYTPDGSRRNCSVFAAVWNFAGNGIFTLGKGVLQITIALKETATSGSPLSFLYDKLGGTVSDLFIGFFIPFAGLMLLFTAIWAGVQMLRRDSGLRTILSGTALALIIVFGGTVLYLAMFNGNSGFRTASAVLDKTAAGINDLGSRVAFDRIAKESGNCLLPDDAPERGQRMSSCVMADGLAYRPWAIGQFGAAGADPIPLPKDTKVVPYDATVDAGKLLSNVPLLQLDSRQLPCYVPYRGCTELRSYLIAQHGGIAIGSAPDGPTGHQMCYIQAFLKPAVTIKFFGQDLHLPLTLACSPMWRTFNVLSSNDLAASTAYAGDVGMARVSQAIVALAGILVVAVAVLVISVITMFWHGKVLANWLAGPFILAQAVSASKAKIALSWGKEILWAWLLRIAYGLALTVVIVAVIAVMQQQMSFGFRIAWLAILLWGFWKLLGKIQAKLRPGESSAAPDLANATKNAAKTGGRHTVNVAKGATRQTVRRTGAAGSAAVSTIKRRRVNAVAERGNRGKLRRAGSALLTPAVASAAAGKAGLTGSSAGSAHRLDRARSKAAPNTPHRGQGANNSTATGTRSEGTAAPEDTVSTTPQRPTPDTAATGGSRPQETNPSPHESGSSTPAGDGEHPETPELPATDASGGREHQMSPGRRPEPEVGRPAANPAKADSAPEEVTPAAGPPTDQSDRNPALAPELDPHTDPPARRRRLQVRLDDLDPVEGTPDRMSSQPRATAPARPLY